MLMTIKNKSLENLLILLREYILLLEELLSCLEKEKMFIIDPSLDELYEVNKQKQNILLKIKLAKESVKNILNEFEPNISLKRLIEKIPRSHLREEISHVYREIVSLSELIEFTNRQNKEFIQDSLNCISDCIYMFINSSSELHSYRKDGKEFSSQAHFFNQKV